MSLAGGQRFNFWPRWSSNRDISLGAFQTLGRCLQAPGDLCDGGAAAARSFLYRGVARAGRQHGGDASVAALVLRAPDILPLSLGLGLALHLSAAAVFEIL